MQGTNEDLESRVENLKWTVERLKNAKESLEIGGICPESESTHAGDPYNIGFIYASLCNSLHCATDALNGILECIEPGGLKEALEDSQLNSDPDKKTEEQIKTDQVELEGDGK